MAWAYPAAAKERPVIAGKPSQLYTVPGSALKVPQSRLDDPWAVIDWLPSEHPPAPDVVIHGRKPNVYACGLCHMVNGEGGSGVPSLAGLSRNYIAEQARAFASGTRSSTFFLRDAMNMTTVAQAAHVDEIAAAAAYYSRMPYRPWIRVVEAARVPKTEPSYWGWRNAVAGSGTEPIGMRVIEIAEDPVRVMLADPHLGFVAYVPPGAIARGQALAARGVPGQPPCSACHGAGLKGADAAPPLAGRSPTYLARQLWDFHTGARHNTAAAPMQPIAAGLDAPHIVDLVAYLASLKR
ncbi:MAG TPA: c-type cytochrome [Rhizomicrobium sp.]|jgi:cytochrome c553